MEIKERVFLILLGHENRLSTPVRRVGDRAPPFALFKSTDAIFIAPSISFRRERSGNKNLFGVKRTKFAVGEKKIKFSRISTIIKNIWRGGRRSSQAGI